MVVPKLEFTTPRGPFSRVLDENNTPFQFNRNRWFWVPIKHPFSNKRRFFFLLHEKWYPFCMRVMLQTFLYVSRIFHYVANWRQPLKKMVGPGIGDTSGCHYDNFGATNENKAGIIRTSEEIMPVRQSVLLLGMTTLSRFQSVTSQIAKFMGPTWGPSGADIGPRCAPCWPMNLAIRVGNYQLIIMHTDQNRGYRTQRGLSWDFRGRHFPRWQHTSRCHQRPAWRSHLLCFT